MIGAKTADRNRQGRFPVNSYWPWAAAVVSYLLFRAWYDNWRGRMSAAEIDNLMRRIAANNQSERERREMDTLRRFLEADDGREFFMLNVIRFADGDVADPKTGELQPARKIMGGYTRMFLPALFARDGHPALAARKIGGFLDTWGIEAPPPWSMMGYVRYRSRRDLAELVCDPRFGGAHDFKYAAIPQTFNFPTRPMLMTLSGPRLTVALVLALAAALGQLAVLLAAR
jgi:hypothetical protein